MDKLEEVKAFAKRHGIINIAKVILDDDRFAKKITEEEFVAMLTEEAKAYQKTGESEAQAFSKMFSAQTPEGLMLRKAHAAVKQANFPSVVTVAPTQVGGKDATDTNTDNSKAYGQLVAMAERLRTFAPELTLEQAFERVYTAPANVNLAEQERRENRPGPGASTSYPMPRREH